jgi:hypothetical protein
MFADCVSAASRKINIQIIYFRMQDGHVNCTAEQGCMGTHATLGYKAKASLLLISESSIFDLQND